MSKIIKCIILGVFFSQANAQIGMGLKLGAALNKTTYDARLIENTVNQFDLDLHGGVVADFGLSQYFAIRTEINYSKKGYSVLKYFNTQLASSQDARNSSTWGINYTYLQIPVILNYKFVDNEKVKFYAGAGIYFAYALAGRKWANLNTTDANSNIYILKSGSETYNFDTDVTYDNKKDRRIDIGAVANIGFAYKISRGEFFIETRYEHGFLDWYSFSGDIPKTYSSTLNRSFTASVGFLLTLKEKNYENSSDSEY